MLGAEVAPGVGAGAEGSAVGVISGGDGSGVAVAAGSGVESGVGVVEGGTGVERGVVGVERGSEVVSGVGVVTGVAISAVGVITSVGPRVGFSAGAVAASCTRNEQVAEMSHSRSSATSERIPGSSPTLTS